MSTAGNRRHGQDAVEEPRDPELDDEDITIDDEDDEDADIGLDEPEDDAD